jgi:hypothetical protein
MHDNVYSNNFNNSKILNKNFIFTLHIHHCVMKLKATDYKRRKILIDNLNDIINIIIRKVKFKVKIIK